jgi:polysaccharide biosynthesis transport protein
MAVTQDVRGAYANGSGTAMPALGLSALVGVLWRNVWTILAVLAVFLTLAAAYLLLTDRKFTAEAKILLDPRDRRILATDTAPTGAGSDTALVESQLALVTSDAVLGSVVDALKFVDNSEWVKEADLTQFMGSPAGEGMDRATAARAVALDNLRKAVSVRRSERTYVMEIRAQSRDAGTAVKIADAVAKGYIAGQAADLNARSRDVNAALTQRLTALRDELRKAEDKLQAFRTKNGLVGAQGTLVAENQLQEMSLRLVQAQARAAEAKSKADKMAALARAGTLGDTTDALASDTLKNLKTALAAARQREAELFPSLGDNHPTLIEARSQVRAIAGQVAAEVARIAGAAKAEADVAIAQERELETALNDIKSNAQTIDSALIGQRDLERDVASARQIYETFLNRAKETRERAGIDTPSAAQIGPATLTSPNAFPGRGLVIGLATLGGLGLGMALALLQAHLKNGVAGAAQARALTGGDVLSVGGARAAGGWYPAADGRRTVERIAASPDLAVAARALRNELRDAPMRRGERILACVSPDSAAASGAVALKLAEAVAVGGERVLLIDADASGGSLSRAMALDGAPGLSEILQGEADLNAVAVKNTERGVWTLGRGVGQRVRPASESAKLREALSAAAAQFDYVIVVPGPALTDADALLISGAADQIVLTLNEHETDADAAQRTVRLLGRDRDKLRRTMLLSGGRPAAAS